MLNKYKEAVKIRKKIARGKQEYRRNLAKLPLKEKIKIVIKLQKIVNNIRKSQGKKEIFVWRVIL